MSEQRIDTGADAATSTDADPGEGMGTADPGAHADPLDPKGHRASGDDAEMPQPAADGPGGAPAADAGAETADTEGAGGLQQTQQTAAAEQRGAPDLSGRQPAGTGAGADRSSASAESGASGTRSAQAETGEVSAPPSPERRTEDPGSVAAEFADRADSAPDDEVARPSL